MILYSLCLDQKTKCPISGVTLSINSTLQTIVFMILWSRTLDTILIEHTVFALILHQMFSEDVLFTILLAFNFQVQRLLNNDLFGFPW